MVLWARTCQRLRICSRRQSGRRRSPSDDVYPFVVGSSPIRGAFCFSRTAADRELTPDLAISRDTVLYFALIAFWGEWCRIIIRWEDVGYTENLAKDGRSRTPVQDLLP